MSRLLGAMVLVTAVAALPTEGRCQDDGTIAVGVLMGSVRLTRIDATVPAEVVSGAAFGGFARFRVWRVELGARYLQAGLSSSAITEDLVEGEVSLGVRPVRWLTIRVGPRVRAHVSPEGGGGGGGGTERWVFWEGRVRGDTRLFGSSVRTYLEGWTSFSGDANLAQPLQRAEGVEGGLIVKLPVWKLWAVASYRFDRAALVGAERVESTDQLLLAVSFGGR